MVKLLTKKHSKAPGLFFNGFNFDSKDGAK